MRYDRICSFEKCVCSVCSTMLISVVSKSSESLVLSHPLHICLKSSIVSASQLSSSWRCAL